VSKLPWSRALREAKARGEVVKLLTTDAPVVYRPEKKFDPTPWYEPVGQTRHDGRECYADIS